MQKKLIALAVAGAALAGAPSASALAPTVRTTAQLIEGTDQYAWSCVISGHPSITSLTFQCNDQRALGTFAAVAAGGVSFGPPRVCWSGTFGYVQNGLTRYASYSGCREGEHLPA